MKIIGLTGSIGMGKSTAASLVRLMGVAVFDSDCTVHDLLECNKQVIRVIHSAWPECWSGQTCRIDRQKLGALAFRNGIVRLFLENLLHPYVWEAQKRFVAHQRRMGAKIVVLDIPLLYETGADRRCDAVICVDAPGFIQRQRVMRRGQMNEEKLTAILARQKPQSEKKKRADVVIPTSLGRRVTYRHLRKFININSPKSYRL